MMRSLFDHEERCRFIGYARTAALQAAATLDILAVRQVKCTQEATEGKSYLADIVRMLVAWNEIWRKDDRSGPQTPYSYTYSYTQISFLFVTPSAPPLAPPD